LHRALGSLRAGQKLPNLRFEGGNQPQVFVVAEAAGLETVRRSQALRSEPASQSAAHR